MCSGEAYDIITTKINRNLNVFINLKSLELEVPMVCLVTVTVAHTRMLRAPCMVLSVWIRPSGNESHMR